MARSRTQTRSVGGYPVMTVNPASHFGPITYLEKAVCVDEKHRGPPYKTGGPLSITKTKYRVGYSQDLSCNLSSTPWYQGKFWIAPTLITGSPISPLGTSALLGWGAKGFNRGLPIHNFGLGQAAVEMKDISQMVTSSFNFFSQFKSHAFSGKSLAFWSDAYLNGQFGWKPALNDFWNMLTFQNQIASKIQKLKAGNGKPVKRHFTLSSSSSDTRLNSTATLAAFQPVLNGAFYDNSGKYNGQIENWVRREQRIWFDGKFTYHIPNLDFIPGHDFRLKLKLAGLMPDLNLIWKETPWSWLFDWFTSAGSAIANASLMQEFSQVAQYAYVMSYQKIEYTTYAFQFIKTGNLISPGRTLIQSSATASMEIKQRAVANPYGFGVTWDSLNPFQLSILLALGLSRSHSGS